MKAHYKARIKQALERYTFPGGYPVYMVMSDGGALCPDCVKSEIRQIVDACRREDTTGGWLPIGSDINWEDMSLICDHCGKQIEFAYGD